MSEVKAGIPILKLTGVHKLDFEEEIAEGIKKVREMEDQAAHMVPGEYLEQSAVLMRNALVESAPMGDSPNPRYDQTLAESIQYAINDMEASFMANDYALYIIEGTPPHTIEANNALALHFFVDGQDMFAVSVDHPGTYPNDFRVDAWDSIQDDIGRLMHDALKSAADQVTGGE